MSAANGSSRNCAGCGLRLSRYNTDDRCQSCLRSGTPPRRPPGERRRRVPDYLPDEILARSDFRDACTRHDFGAMFVIIHEYKDQGWTFIHIGRRCEISNIRNYTIGGTQLVNLHVIERVSDGLHIPGDMLGIGRRLWEAESADSPSPQAFMENYQTGKLTPSISEVSEGMILSWLGDEGEVSQTLRRDFLGLGGAISVANLPSWLENELNRMHITLSRGSVNDERLTYLEQCADDLGILVASAAPTAALHPALAALASVRAFLEERQPTRSQARLVAVSAKLSLVVGVEAFQLGQVRQAHEWHKAAQYAASDAGIQYLADVALAQQAFVPLYSGKPAEVVRLITPRLDSNPSPSPAVSQLWGIKARAHAALGERDSFRRSIESGQDCLDHSEPGHIGPGVLSFHPANLAFYETTGAVALNDLGNSLDAATRALTLFADTESYDQALVGLERACALAKAGELAEACHTAKSVILDPKTYYCTPVREYACKFSDEIRSASSPDAREWRETLAAIDKAHRPEFRQTE